MVNVISANIDSGWQEWLEWPQQQIRDRYPILGSTSALNEEYSIEKDLQKCTPEASETPPAVDIRDGQSNFAFKLLWKKEMVTVPQSIDKFYTTT